MFNLNHPARGAVVGFILIALGGIFLLDQAGIIRADYAFRLFWPAVLIGLGLLSILQPSHPSRTFWGGLLLLLGIVLMVNNLGIAHIRFEMFWPLWIIAAGVWMLLRTSGYGGYPRHGRHDWKGGQPPPQSPPQSPPPRREDWWTNPAAAAKAAWANQAPGSTESTFDYSSIFGHIDRRIISKNFRGGKIAAVFGGCTIDLTQADIEGPEAVLHADSVFGGGEIYVPDTWLITVKGAAVFGGYANETRQRPPENAAAAKHLIIEGAAVFGGIVIRN